VDPYAGWGAQTSLTSKLAAGITAACLPEEIRANYRRMLADICAKPAAPKQQ
jgi:hypothetical protein